MRVIPWRQGWWSSDYHYQNIFFSPPHKHALSLWFMLAVFTPWQTFQCAWVRSDRTMKNGRFSKYLVISIDHLTGQYVSSSFPYIFCFSYFFVLSFSLIVLQFKACFNILYQHAFGTYACFKGIGGMPMKGCFSPKEQQKKSTVSVISMCHSAVVFGAPSAQAWIRLMSLSGHKGPIKNID